MPEVQAANDGAGAVDQEAAELVRTNLLKGMVQTWDELLDDALMGVMYGHAVAEKVWAERDGYIMLQKLAPRHQRTISKWGFDRSGVVTGLYQSGQDGLGEYHTDLFIPADRFVLFSWRGRAGNPEGRALFRSMYRAWFQKDLLWKVLMIGLERMWLGLPVAKEPERGDTEKAKANREVMLTLLTQVRAGEQAGIILPSGWELDTALAQERTGTDIIIKVLQMLDTGMARSALAEFLMLGSTDVGAKAVADPQLELFLTALNGISSWVCEALNRYVIEPLCRYNFPGLDAFPEIVIPHVGANLKLAQLGDALSKLAGTDFIIPEQPVVEYVHSLLGLPAPSENAVEERQQQQEKQLERQQQQQQPSEITEGDPSTSPAKSSVRLAAAAGASGIESLPLGDIGESLTALEDGLSREMRALIEKQIGALTKRLKRSITAAAGGSARSKRTLLKALDGLELPLQSEYQALLLRYLEAAGDSAAAASKQWLGVAPPREALRELGPLCLHEASALAQKHAGDLVFALRSQVVADLESGLSAEEIVWNLEQAARERRSVDFSGSLLEAADRIGSGLSAAMRAG